MTPQEAASIRAQLQLRWNSDSGCFEVFTTIHGTGVFRWYKISEATKDWYVKQFGLTVQNDVMIFNNSGAITRNISQLKESFK